VSEEPQILPSTWLVECKSSGTWVLTVAYQETGLCARCGKSIFENKQHRA
jgi:hypothetical protein